MHWFTHSHKTPEKLEKEILPHLNLVAGSVKNGFSQDVPGAKMLAQGVVAGRGVMM